MDTIFALSSGRPPAAIAIVRISGPEAFSAARAIAGIVPEPRRATLRTLRDVDGDPLDQALVLAFPASGSATGEDLVEFHLHGGRAVVDAVLHVLGTRDGLRSAVPGEFTRRALENGRIDLAQAQGLADLLSAENDHARRAALAASEGLISRAVGGWLAELSAISALVEAALDHSDEDDVGDDVLEQARSLTGALLRQVDAALSRPTVERLRDGFLVVLAGPPNAGKSSLFNALLEREAAIVTPIAGTTRDVLEADVVRNGITYRLVDTAGLALGTSDPVEAIGVARAQRHIAHADLVLWLGDVADAPDGSIPLHARDDEPSRAVMNTSAMRVSVHRPDSVEAIWSLLERHAGAAPDWNSAHFHHQQREVIEAAADTLRNGASGHDPLISAEHLRQAHRALARLLGVDATEAMLDALFGRFCIGK